MFESIVGFGVPMRPPRVPVPAFPDSYLPGVDSSTESRTLYTTWKVIREIWGARKVLFFEINTHGSLIFIGVL
jgi:hypothetical protein